MKIDRKQWDWSDVLEHTPLLKQICRHSSGDQQEEFNLMKLITALSVTAHVPLIHPPTPTLRHITRKSHRSCKNIRNHTRRITQAQTDTRTKANAHIHIVKCLHCQVRGSHVQAGALGPVTHCRKTHTWRFYAPCVRVYLCVFTHWPVNRRVFIQCQSHEEFIQTPTSYGLSFSLCRFLLPHRLVKADLQIV